MTRALISAVLLSAGLAAAQQRPPRPEDGPQAPNCPVNFTCPLAAWPNAYYPDAVSPAVNIAALQNATSPPFYPSPWMDGSGGWTQAYQRAQDFVRQLTLLEKVNLTTGVGWQQENCVGNVGSIPRLGFRSLCMQDSPTGLRFGDYTSYFPAGGTVAASFDRGLFYARGLAMGAEHRGKGVDVQLGPAVGPLGRAPEGGRNWEGFSPDPVLTGIAVGETVRGIQDAGVIATTKHYILNEQEHFRQAGEAPQFNISESSSSNIDDATMHELYLWPFADAVRAGTGAIMCSYQQINNSYGCQNAYTQNYLLKGELGFQGFIMSDWQAQHAGVATALAGLDMSMPGDTVFGTGRSYWGANLTLAVINGSVPEWRLDDMATRIVAAWYFVEGNQGQIPTNFNSWTFDTYGYLHYLVSEGYQLVNQHVDVRRNHGRLIRDMASRSTVLLKNTGGLPLTGQEKFTAVIGEDADNNRWGPNGCPDVGCDMGTLAAGWGSGTGVFPYLVTPLDAIRANQVANNRVVQGVTDNRAYSQMRSVARQACQVEGVSIVFVNADAGEGYITVDNNRGDRNNLTTWLGGEAMIGNVTQECNNTVVVIHSVGPVNVTNFYQNDNVTAIVWAGLPGQESGNSIADILYGRVNPGAKTPFTWGLAREDYGTDVLYAPNNGNNAPQDVFGEGVFIDYRRFDRAGIEPAYEFGFGLSYTTFTVSDLAVQSYNVGSYTPNSGTTRAAPQFANYSRDTSAYQFPPGFNQVPLYIYPYLNSTDEETAANETTYSDPENLPAGSQDGSPQRRIAAGGAPGGNPQLYDVLFSVECTVTNTGDVPGEEVPQLYLNLGGPNDPVNVLRGFQRLSIQPGQSARAHFDITRRDLSNWDTVSQNWVITDYPKTVRVGTSSRNLPLTATLDI